MAEAQERKEYRVHQSDNSEQHAKETECQAMLKAFKADVEIVLRDQFGQHIFGERLRLGFRGAAVSLAIFPVLLLVVIIQLLYIRRVETV